MGEQRTVAIVFAGGLGLAAYHAGVFEQFAKGGGVLHWVTGSSAGAVTAALIAGNSSGQRIENPQTFWHRPAEPAAPRSHLSGWMGAVGTRIFGSSGHFVPRLPSR